MVSLRQRTLKTFEIEHVETMRWKQTNMKPFTKPLSSALAPVKGQ